MLTFPFPIFARMEEVFDVLIIGGGPAGSAAAIELVKHDSIKFAIIEGASFPRDKICGDAIPGPAHIEMTRIFGDDKIINEIFDSRKISATRIADQKKEILNIEWVMEAYNAPRLSFDNYLFQHAIKLGVECFQKTKVREIQRKENLFEITSSDGRLFRCKMIIAADGTNSIVRKQLAPKLDTSPKLVGIRQYYRGVKLSKNHNHIYFRNGTNGYFWAFPLKDDLWNIGYGTPEHKSKKNGNVKDEYLFFINHFPELKKAMANAEPQEKIVGHKLASFSKKAKISGDGFMLAGDAGFLIDPAWGHGIDKAMISGRYAAETAIEAIKTKDFSSNILKKYDQKVHQRFGSEMRRQYLMVKYFGKYNGLLKFISPFLKMIDKRVS